MNNFKNIILAIIAPIDFWYFMWAVSTMLISLLIFKFTREIFLRKMGLINLKHQIIFSLIIGALITLGIFFIYLLNFS
jgi:hypothetical protein